MPGFDEFLSALTENMKQFALENWKGYQKEVVSDGSAFMNKVKSDLKRWTENLVAEVLTKEDFEWLVKGKKDLAEMEALKQVGLTKAKIDRCRNGLVDIVIKTTFKMLI